MPEPSSSRSASISLVKTRSLEGRAELTGATATLRTSLYMSPEAVEHRELDTALGGCSAASQWSRDDAEDWWRRYDSANIERTSIVAKPQSQPA